MKERIQKLLANAGVASRRKIEEMVRMGRVSVNGTVTIDLPILIDPERDNVAVDDQPVPLRRESKGQGGSSSRPRSRGSAKPAAGGSLFGRTDGRIYILLNKPKDVYSTNVAQGEQTRAIDLLPPDLPARVYPVGRLDSQSKGLLLLTNDGDLTEKLTHPRYGVSKTYRAVVDGFVSGECISTMSHGVWIADPRKGTGIKTGRCQITIVKRTRERSVLDITLNEGRNSQMRRMLAKLGHKVRELTRTRLGPLTLDKLGPGESRLLSPLEVKRLQQWTEHRKGDVSTGSRDSATAHSSAKPAVSSANKPAVNLSGRSAGRSRARGST